MRPIAATPLRFAHSPMLLPLLLTCAAGAQPPASTSTTPDRSSPPSAARSSDATAAAAPADSAARPAAVTPTAASNRVLRAEDFKGLSWRSIGPANMGGRVADISVAPGKPTTFFVGFGTGGLWKTTNGGTTYAPVFDKEETSSIGSVVVADAPPDWPGWKDEPPPTPAASKPSDEAEKGKAKIVWVGTGEGNGRNSSSYGCGVYRSTDGGATFKHVGLRDSHDIPRLAVDPRNPDVCYVAALGHLWGANKERGVFKTGDGGRTWKAVLQIDENTGACDVILDPQNPQTVFAAMYMRRRAAHSFRSGGPQGGIYRSRDAGATWTKLTNGLPPQTGRIGIDIYAKNPRIMYAVVESDSGGWPVDAWNDRSTAGGVFRSTDGGDTWTRVFDRNPRGFYFAKIRVDPTDDQRVYVLGYTLWVSDDGGRSFRAGGARRPHGDLHAMVINPVDRDHLYLGTDGGIYVSHDRAATWDFHNHLAVGQFYNIAVDSGDPYRVGGGLQDNGSWIGPSGTIWDTGPEDMMSEQPGVTGSGITNHDWRFINNGDGFHVAFDPQDPNIVYAEMQGGELARIHLDTGRRKRIRPAPKEGSPRFRFNWNAPFFISPHSPTTLYFGGNYVFKLTERGSKWERISEDLSTRAIEKLESVGSEAETHCTVVSLAESPLAAGWLWAGTDDGRVHLTQDDGKRWADVTPPAVAGRYISRVEPSHHDRHVCYVSVDGHRMDDMDPCILVTADAGRTWKNIESDLPKGAHVVVVREDRRNADVLYCGSERAAYISIDRGAHWVKLNAESLPTVPVDDLLQHPRAMDLLAGTHGRSIYVLDDAGPLSALTPAVVNSAVHLFDVRPAKPVLFLDYAGFWSDRVFKAANPPMGAIITYWLREYTGDEVKIAITDANGTSVNKLTGPQRPGFNRVVWNLQREKHDQISDVDAMLSQTQFVPPGEYTVTLTYGKEKASTKVTVLPAPPEL